MRKVFVASGFVFLCVSLAHAGEGLKPLAADQWNREHAAHLIRRAGFDGTPEEIDRLFAKGLDRAVDDLVDYEQFKPIDPDMERIKLINGRSIRRLRQLPDGARDLMQQALRQTNNAYMQSVREWWVRRMVLTNRPLEEKMVLFWHGHFTSGYREVRDWGHMYDQNQLLRKHALGQLRPLLLDISRDPAMLIYLDGTRNRKGNPNENYARELLELFTLGEGYYTETDIKEAARALTGWRVNAETADKGPTAQLIQRQHDAGEKTFLGQTGNLTLEDVIDIILKQERTSHYIAECLFDFFAYRNPEPEIVASCAWELRRTDYDIRAAMRMLLKSEVFYSDKAYFVQTKSPVELIVGTYRTLGQTPGNPNAMAQAATRMGQELFQPPNVKGWDGGRQWINTSTLFQRYNFGQVALARVSDREIRRSPAARMESTLALISGEESPTTEALAQAPQRRRHQMESMMMVAEDPAYDAIREAFANIKPPTVWTRETDAYDPLPTIHQYQLQTLGEIADHFADRLLHRKLTPSQRTTIIETASPQGKSIDLDAKDAREKIRAMIQLMMSMPEYQLN